MSFKRDEVTLLDGAISGRIAVPDETAETPMLVLVHGGGANALSMDIPGHSFIGTAARCGFPAIALNRPGYGGSSTLGFPADSDDGLLAANASRLIDAIGEAWERYGRNTPGVVVYGSSVGGAVVLHLASQWSEQSAPTWPLLGVATADVAQKPPQKALDAWHGTPVTESVNIAALQPLLDAPPLWTIPTYAFDPSALPGVFAPVIRAEMMEIIGGWARNWKEIATSITVPVHYRLAQYDTFWQVAPELIDEFATALRAHAPYVDAGVFAGSAHGLADSPAGDEYFHLVLGYALRCAANLRTPELLSA
ncbi:alpha/beta fold hydrolase [Dactylosporangium cerinum]|uniref:Alpha/beta fold hydrolase n=1 Tax=Dactylosporangium cerinum TaxID=1434730 RepID=A0ABV9W3Q6_9ACTN